MTTKNLPFYEIDEFQGETPKGTILISIREEYGTIPKLNQWECPKLILRFSDVPTPEEENGKWLRPMQKTHAKAIIEFLEIHKETTNQILVNCHAGVSRSASIVIATHLLYQAKLPKNFWQLSRPKADIIKLLLEAYQTHHGRLPQHLLFGPGNQHACHCALGEAPIEDIKMDFHEEIRIHHLHCGQCEDIDPNDPITLCPKLCTQSLPTE